MSDAEAAVAFRMAAAQRIREAVGVDEREKPDTKTEKTEKTDLTGDTPASE
jgi:hypothetical protein